MASNLLINAYNSSSSSQKLVNDQFVDVSTRDGAFYGDLWGLRGQEQSQRRRELNHLDQVIGDGFAYNLEDIEQATAFVNDIADGSLDGSAGMVDGSVVVSGSTITVGYGAAKYDLKSLDDYNRMRADNADGKLDGRIGGGEVVSQDGHVAARAPGAPAASSSGPTAPASQASGPSAGSATEDATSAELIKRAVAMTPEELMRQMMSGKLDPAIMNDQGAMLAINQKLQAWQRMMEMITTMLKMHHETSMSIIRSMRS